MLNITKNEDGVESVSSLAGYEILSEGTSANSGSCLINLKPWSDRKHSAKEIVEDLEKKCKTITDADIEFFQPPSIPGYGAASGFELRLLDKTGNNNYHQMEKVSKDFVRELNKRPEVGSAFTFYSASYPQYMLRVNNDLAEQKGVTVGSAMDNLSTLIGSDYETGFIRFGKPYKVIVQASPQYRAFPENLMELTAKNNNGEMVPYADFMQLQKVYGMSEITRHNLYNSAEVTGSPAPGYSSGQAIKAIEQVADFDEEMEKLESKKSVFRIYRDTRFSKDKTPYKTNFGAGLGMGKGNKVSGYYLHIEPGKSFLAGGVYKPEPTVLKTIRQEISVS